MSKNGFTAGSPPRTPLRWLIALPQTHSWTKGDGREKEGRDERIGRRGEKGKGGREGRRRRPVWPPYLQLLDPPVL